MSRARASASAGVSASLMPPGLAAPAGEHLRLDDHRAAQLLRSLTRLERARREPAVRDGDPDAPEELLALVLVEVHRGASIPTRGRAAVVACEHGWMRRAPLALCIVLVALVPPAAPRSRRRYRRPRPHPRRRRSSTGWSRLSEKAPRLVFSVTRIDVLPDGWRADVAIRNETADPLGDRRSAGTVDAPFGLMLFATGDLDGAGRPKQRT